MSGFWEIKKIADLGLAHLPVNSIMSIYVKTALEVTDLKAQGWWLCDGSGGTPNLTNHFIMGGSPGSNVTGDQVQGTLATEGHVPTHSEIARHGHKQQIARSEHAPVNPDEGAYGSWKEYYPNGHPETGGTHEQTDDYNSGDSDPHSHGVDAIPDHIVIGYFMYTGIPG